jgi:hypothetical protein
VASTAPGCLDVLVALAQPVTYGIAAVLAVEVDTI